MFVISLELPESFPSSDDLFVANKGSPLLVIHAIICAKDDLYDLISLIKRKLAPIIIDI